MFMKNVPVHNQLQDMVNRQANQKSVSVMFKRSKKNGFKITRQVLVCHN